MTKREDGRITKKKLLETACKIFAQKGFRDAKIAKICKKAGVNVAAVNYYFGDKGHLYMEAWNYSLETIGDFFLPEDSDSPAEEKLRQYIRLLVKNFFSNDSLGRFSRLYLMEMLSPTGLIQDSWQDLIEPKRKRLHHLIQNVIGCEVPDLSLRMCELSIIGQCRTLVSIKPGDLEHMLGRPIDGDLIEALADHVIEFSLAGLRQIGLKNQDWQ